VKINNLTNGLVATLLIVSPIVGAETEYPAADFKPKVIYQDIDSSQSKSAPAAVSKSEKSVEVDSNYPAANFEPKVLYKDADYKPGKLTESASASQRATSASENNEVAASGAENAPEESMLTYLLGLAVFAVAGFIFLGKRGTPKAKVSDAPVYSGHVSGLSGVARYMRKHNLAAVTGVGRYLETHVTATKTAAPVSGVEKYLEKQAVSEQEKAAQARTGVEKYMRNRG